MNKVLILGGYGNFGKRIAKLFIRQKIHVIIAGRSIIKAQEALNELGELFCEVLILDVNNNFLEHLGNLIPKVVINTCGPFQNADYHQAKQCIAFGVHYIDLSDGREFVAGISTLHESAKASGVAVISGASTVPGLSSAVVEYYLQKHFSKITELKYGISPGQKSGRGVATTASIMSYVGKKLKPCGVGNEERYGWQDLYVQKYPQIGNRLMCDCDVPDLDLFPKKYGIKNIRFSAGIENSFLHLGLWCISWLIRLGLPINLSKYTNLLLKISDFFNFIGSNNGGMHIIVSGVDNVGKKIVKKWFIIALSDHGPYIPAVASVVLAKKIINNELNFTGAVPCLGLVTLEEYLRELEHLEIRTYEK
jgi:hypothetical protein